MYTKEELEQMELSQLMGVAQDLGIKVSQNDELETVIYAILDKAAEESAVGNTSAKRKRTRITKKDTDRVYTVSGKDGENFDTKSRGKKTAEAPSLFGELPVATPDPVTTPATPDNQEKPEKPAPKKRGRKSKAELAAIAAEESAKAETEEKEKVTKKAASKKSAKVEKPDVDETFDDTLDEVVVPEAVNDIESSSSDADEDLLEQLQQKVKEHNSE